jgi:hypothetical protein
MTLKCSVATASSSSTPTSKCKKGWTSNSNVATVAACFCHSHSIKSERRLWIVREEVSLLAIIIYSMDSWTTGTSPCVRSAESLPLFLGRWSCNGTRASTTPNSDPIGGRIESENSWHSNLTGNHIQNLFPLPNGRRVSSNLPSLRIPLFDDRYPSFKGSLDVNWTRRSVARRAKTARKDATTRTGIAEPSAVDDGNDVPRHVPPSTSQQSAANRLSPSRLRRCVLRIALWRRHVPQGNSSGAFSR